MMDRQQFSSQEMNQDNYDGDPVVPLEKEQSQEHIQRLLFSVLMSFSILTVAVILIIVILRIMDIYRGTEKKMESEREEVILARSEEEGVAERVCQCYSV